MTLNVSRDDRIFILFAFVMAFIITHGLVNRPTFTDAYYHFNSAQRIADGDGFSDTYLWIYVGAPDTLLESGAFPSHLYWMPFTSIVAAVGMMLFGFLGEYAAAQLPFTLMFAGIVLIAYWLGGYFGGTARHKWVAGLLMLFAGFFTRWWGQIDTFAPYGLVGSLALVFIGLMATSEDRKAWQFAVLAGVFAGLGHLTRADGLLLLGVGWLVVLWGIWRKPVAISQRLQLLALLTLGYCIVMLPWFIRNMNEIGSPLPLGGTQAIWLSDYNELFNYPPQVTAQGFFADGVSTFLDSRLEALLNNFGTFVAVEGLVILAPLMLMGLWNRRKSPFLRGFWMYAFGLHIVMTFVFPYPGYRGGLFHSASALMPFWVVLGVVGLDDVIDWIAKRRRSWKPRTAKIVFSGGLVTLAFVLSLQFGLGTLFDAKSTVTPAIYTELMAELPPESRIMVNDPAELYYFTGMGGVVTPNATAEMIPEIARRYNINYLLVRIVEREGRNEINIPPQLAFDFDNPPQYLREIELDTPNMRLYAILPDEA
ncbi:MAG: hypothetical protein RLP44_26015 [Aggregatilineales bacterium]